MQNKSIKALIIGISLLPSLVFADGGRFFNFNILPNSPFYFLDKFDEFLDRVLTFRSEKKIQLETKLNKEREEESLGKQVDDDPTIGGQVKESINKIKGELEDWGDDRDGEMDDDEEEDDDRKGSRSNTTSSPSVIKPSSTQTSNTSTVKTYTMSEVATHNSSVSCWSVVNGGVYDLTSWIGQHPGGASAIKGICGVDGSADFNGQHGGQARPVSELAGFKIGVLK